MTIGEFVPNSCCAYIDINKITKYLLNLDHEKGAAKARFFIKGGFSVEKPDELIEALKNHLKNRKIVNEITDDNFVKYVVECQIDNPNETNPCIVSVWITEKGEKCPRLITAYPK